MKYWLKKDPKDSHLQYSHSYVPGPHTRIDNSYFSEHLLTLLAIPSFICRGKVGQRIGNMKVDKWGESVLNATVQGNHFKANHDAVKN